MAENTELEDLDHLINSPGWARFVDAVDKQWGAAGDRYASAITNAARIGADADAMAQLRQIIAAQREIQAVMSYIPNRVKLLKHEQPQLVGSRRGPL